MSVVPNTLSVTSPYYRFYTADLLTGNVLGDIQLHNVTASMTLNSFGEFQGSFPLGQAVDSFNLSLTQPGRTAIYVERNDELIWGGIIWSRVYNNEGDRIVTITAQTFDSYYEHVVLEKNYVKQNVEQVTCFTSLVSKVNAQAASDIGITCPSITATGVTRTILLPAYEFHFAFDVIDQLINLDDGLDYTVELAKTGTADHPSKTIRLGSVDQLNIATVLVLDFPGSIRSYSWPENATQGGNKFAGRGGGDGNLAPTAHYRDQNSLDAGYPALWQVSNYPDIIKQGAIKSKTKRMRKTHAVPVAKPPLTVSGNIMVGYWQKMGAKLTFAIDDVRFTSRVFSRRLYQWDMTFEDGEVAEEVSITTDNGDS